jgi:NADH:ubiquinone oxidoreductase subunit 6 (subunit J)
MEQVVFYLFAFLLVASAIAVVTLRNIFHCALFLIMALFSVAALYVLLSAEFLAVVQVLLYVGAVAILMIFAIMLTSKLAGREIMMTNEQTFIGLFLSLVLVLGLIYSYTRTIFRTVAAPAPEQSSLAIGKLLMTDFVLPFELVSVLLLAALIGAIIIARQEGN